MTSIQEAIIKVPMFRDLSKEAVNLMAECAQEVNFEPETQILTEGAIASTFYIIQTGTVSLQIREPQAVPLVVQTINPNSLLGLSWITPPYQWSFDAFTLERVTAIEFHSACVREKLLTHPEHGFSILQSILNVFLERLQATRTRMLDIYNTDRKAIPGD